MAHVARAAGWGQAGVSRLSILRGRAKCKAKRVRAQKKTRKLKKQFDLNCVALVPRKVYSSHPRWELFDPEKHSKTRVFGSDQKH